MKGWVFSKCLLDPCTLIHFQCHFHHLVLTFKIFYFGLTNETPNCYLTHLSFILLLEKPFTCTKLSQCPSAKNSCNALPASKLKSKSLINTTRALLNLSLDYFFNFIFRAILYIPGVTQKSLPPRQITLSLHMFFFHLESSYHISVLSSQFPLRKLTHIFQVLAELSLSINNIALLQRYFHFDMKNG